MISTGFAKYTALMVTGELKQGFKKQKFNRQSSTGKAQQAKLNRQSSTGKAQQIVFLLKSLKSRLNAHGCLFIRCKPLLPLLHKSDEKCGTVDLQT